MVNCEIYFPIFSETICNFENFENILTASSQEGQVEVTVKTVGC